LGVTSSEKIIGVICGKLMKTAGGLPFLGLLIFWGEDLRGYEIRFFQEILGGWSWLQTTPNAVDPNEFCFKRSHIFGAPNWRFWQFL